MFFRPDRGQPRFEVVVELGWPGDAPLSSASYIATIKRGGRTHASISVPEHYCWSRWRWQSAPRLVRKSSGALQTSGKVPRFDPSLTIGRRPKFGLPDRYEPMSFPRLAKDMGATGERGEIGIITEAQAEWLVTGNPGALAQMLVQAEAHGSVPVHVRDATMAPISIERYPTASSFWDKGAGHADPWVKPKAPIRPERAHYPSLAFVPFLLTGDPYYLEEVQFTAQSHLLNYNTSLRNRDQGVLGSEQTRGYAWGMRSLFQAALATPDEVPSWLLPRSYFSRIIANNLAMFTARQMEDTSDPLKANCHFAIDVSLDHIAPWQQDFLTAVLGWAVRAGFTEWRAPFRWHSQQAIGRAGGTSGYPRSQAVKYYYKTDGVHDWPSLASANGLAPTLDGNYPPKTSIVYASYLRAGLAFAAREKVPGAKEALDYAEAQLLRRGSPAYKWAFAR